MHATRKREVYRKCRGDGRDAHVAMDGFRSLWTRDRVRNRVKFTRSVCARGASPSLTRLQSLLRVVVTDELDDFWLVSFLILFFFDFFFWY